MACISKTSGLFISPVVVAVASMVGQGHLAPLSQPGENSDPADNALLAVATVVEAGSKRPRSCWSSQIAVAPDGDDGKNRFHSI
jgi:hypothetical protein